MRDILTGKEGKWHRKWLEQCVFARHELLFCFMALASDLFPLADVQLHAALPGRRNTATLRRR
jgi:hypothetical protein